MEKKKNILGVVVLGLLSSCVCHTEHLKNNEGRAMLKPEQNSSEPQNMSMNNVYFAFDQYELSDSSKEILRANAEWLRSNNDVDVKIEGNADERGTNSYNLTLGRNRALSAATYLKLLGINSRRISTISYGEEQPVDTRHTQTAWSKNRRVEFKALGLNHVAGNIEHK